MMNFNKLNQPRPGQRQPPPGNASRGINTTRMPPAGRNQFPQQYPNPNPNQQYSTQPVPNPMQQMQPMQKPMSEADRRHKMAADQLIRDCYSKAVVGNGGKRFTEVSYQTHIAIEEFSLWPSLPPPVDLDPTQLGSVKTRVLVISIKYSGRVIIQKGKYNEAKNVYQIGRTWDMDELTTISKAGNDGFVLSLNKDYYWRSPEGIERVWKFIRALANSYGGFMGRYPVINGWSLQDLKLNPLTKKSVGGPAPMNSGQNPSSPNPDLYKDLDFTANGMLPMKPMMAMLTDRQSPKQKTRSMVTPYTDVESTTSQEHAYGHPYLQRSSKSSLPRQSEQNNVYPDKPDDASINDSHSFIFKSSADDHRPLSIHEYAARNDGASSPMRNYKPQVQVNGKRLVSPDAIENSAALGSRLQEQLDDPIDTHSFEFPPPPATSKAQGLSPDFGIEEVDDSDTSVHQVEEEKQRGLGIIDNNDTLESSEIIEESTKIEGSNAIDTSIQEIEAFMDSQLDFGKRERGLKALHSQISEDDTHEDSRQSYTIDEESEVLQHTENTEELALNISKPAFNVEKDAELEEIFDEINWNVKDTSETLLKKLSSELGQLKHLNVKELASLDFGASSLSNDLSTALAEVESLNHIFKKLEVDFKFLGPEISSIEDNSKGLQVRSINKKLLYNDLKTILDKVSLNSDSLQLIERFNDFHDFNQLNKMEPLLVELYNALGTIGHNTGNDSFSRMRALQQYQGNYENVTASFIRHFSGFFHGVFEAKLAKMAEKQDRLFPRDVLNDLKDLLLYSGVSYFIKSSSSGDFTKLKEYVNSLLDSFLEELIMKKLRNVKYAAGSISSRISDNRKSKTRLSIKNNIIGKLGLSDDHTRSPDISQGEVSGKQSNEIEDPNIVVNMINETSDLIAAVQIFIGSFFHYDLNLPDFGNYISEYSVRVRAEELNTLHLDQVEGKSYSNDLIPNMNVIFGNYINSFIKRVTPNSMTIPVLILRVDEILKESEKKNQEFLVYGFLRKVLDKFKGMWNKVIKSQVEQLKNGTIISQGGIMDPVKSLNQLIYLTESSMQSQRAYDAEDSEVREMLDRSYKDLTEAAITFFMKDDPLLKSRVDDDKARENRSVTILQNLFTITQQLNELNSPATNKMKVQLESVFKKVQDGLFESLIHKYIGKLTEFIKNYEISSSQGSKNRKNEKKYLKALLSNYTSKEISSKAAEIHKKLEKYVITGDDMFEQDLLKKLWVEMESQFNNYFSRLSKICKEIDRDIDYNVSKQEIHHIFTSVHSTR